MIHQLNIYGLDMVEVSIERLKAFEPAEGYFLAFSGGKDSCVIKALADMAGVKYDAHYQITSVDPPELVKFVKGFPDVKMEHRRYPDRYKNKDLRGHVITMWNLIPEKRMPPTRIVRYCCEFLKEGSGEGRFVVTGIRKEESYKRSLRGGLELSDSKSQRMENYDPDNPTPELMYHCQQYYRKVLNPIYDWTTEEVWEFIREYKIPYCELYDKGYTRLGCIGCPIGGSERMKKEFQDYPQYKKAYLSAFRKMIHEREEKGLKTAWTTPEEVMEWWIGGK